MQVAFYFYEECPWADLSETAYSDFGEKIIISIENYIVANGDEHKRHDNSKTFASMRVFLIDEKEENNLYYVYAWVLEECFYYEEGKIINESGSSIPYKFVVEKINDKLKEN